MSHFQLMLVRTGDFLKQSSESSLSPDSTRPVIVAGSRSSSATGISHAPDACRIASAALVRHLRRGGGGCTTGSARAWRVRRVGLLRSGVTRADPARDASG
eukprot:753165-Hanusia_phi.AAC.1